MGKQKKNHSTRQRAKRRAKHEGERSHLRTAMRRHREEIKLTQRRQAQEKHKVSRRASWRQVIRVAKERIARSVRKDILKEWFVGAATAYFKPKERTTTKEHEPPGKLSLWIKK